MGGETVYHNCSYCADRFSLSVALLLHKIQCHSWDSNGRPNGFDTFFAELIKNETKCSSDANFNYTINITTSVTQTAKESFIKGELEIISDDTHFINMEISEPTKLEQNFALSSKILLDPNKTLCRLCGLEKSKKNLPRHMRTVHKNEIDPKSEASMHLDATPRSAHAIYEDEPVFEEIDIKDPLIPETSMFSLVARPTETPTNVENFEIIPMKWQSFKRYSPEINTQKAKGKIGNCPVCGAEMLASSVSRHVKRVHTKKITNELNAAQEKCPICQRVVIIRNLKAHLVNVHEFPKSLIKDVNLRATFKCLKCLEVHPRSDLEIHFMNFHNIRSFIQMRGLHVTADLPEFISLEASSERSPSFGPVKRFKPRCPICKRGILRRNMRKHLISAHELNDSDLKTNLSLTNLRSESNRDISKCTLCDYIGTTIALRLHDKLKHSVERTISLSKMHEKNEPIPLIYRNGRRGYNCTLCQYDETTRLNMLAHLLSEHSETINQLNGVHFDCDVCPKVVKSFTDFESHQNKHIYALGLDQFFCDYCGVHKRSKTTLKLHLLAHLNLRNFICDICQKRFNTKRLISEHMTAHSDVSYQCNVDGCEARYRRKEKLREHKQVHHSATQKRYQCETCGKKFPLKSYLRLHSYGHLREFKCRICDKTFPSRQSLKAHRESNCC